MYAVKIIFRGFYLLFLGNITDAADDFRRSKFKVLRIFFFSSSRRAWFSPWSSISSTGSSLVSSSHSTRLLNSPANEKVCFFSVKNKIPVFDNRRGRAIVQICCFSNLRVYREHCLLIQA